MKIDTIVLATGNQHKVEEMKAILKDIYCEEGYVPAVKSMRELGFDGDIVEDGATYLDNALIKACAVANAIQNKQDLGVWMVLADDSGVEYEALGGKPGLYSARWYGELPTEEKNKKVLEELEAFKGAERNGSYQCFMAGIFQDGSFLTGHGELLVFAAEKPSGNGGFGYDPIMSLRKEEYLNNGLDALYKENPLRTIAELGTDVKNKISHRNRAIIDLFTKVLDK